VSTPFFQSVTPDPVPSPITPADTPPGRPGAADSDGMGTAPYDISAPQDIAGITAACDAAGQLVGAGIVYPGGPRQSEARALLNSPQGAPAMDVTSGFPDYENTSFGVPDLETPIQGEMSYPAGSTMQDGITQFMDGLGAGVEGVPPESGDMGPGGGGYPGTMQSGLQTYGT
jgi:hypothetical protein